MLWDSRYEREKSSFNLWEISRRTRDEEGAGPKVCVSFGKLKETRRAL